MKMEQNVIRQDGLKKVENDKYAMYTRTVVFRKKDGTNSQVLRQFQIQKRNALGESIIYPNNWYTLGLASEFDESAVGLFAELFVENFVSD